LCVECEQRSSSWINHTTRPLAKYDFFCQNMVWLRGKTEFVVCSQRETMLPPQAIDTFGAILKFLRRRARLTQMELGSAVGYDEAHISRLENGQRLPDLASLAALFIPALDLQNEPNLAKRLLELAERTHGKIAPRIETARKTTTEIFDIVGAIESIPLLPPYFVPRAIQPQLGEQLALQRGVVLVGMAGIGKTTLAAALALDWEHTQPVFWLTFTTGITTSIEIVIRHLALFALAHGRAQVIPILAQRDANTPPLALDQQLALINLALSDHDYLLCFDRVNLVCDDESILRVFTHLLATVRATLLLTSREELPLPGVMQIRLSGMADAEASQLLTQLRSKLVPALAEQLIAKTGGSPMLLRLAIGQLGVGRDAAALIAHLETEPEVAAFLLDAVLKSLSPQALRLAELLSVFRQPVNLYDETLFVHPHQLGLQPLNIGQAIAELVQRQLIDQPGAALLHPLVRDHIYTLLNSNLARQRALHRLVGEWLAKNDPSQLFQAAYHLGRANVLKRAVNLLTNQAAALIENGQSEMAVQVIDELIVRARHLKNPGELLQPLLMARGDLLVTTAHVLQAEENYREALRLTQQPAVRAHIALRLAGSLIARNCAVEALGLCDAIAPELSEQSYLLLSAQLAAVYAQAHLTLANLDAAQCAANRSLELAERLRQGTPREAASVEAQVHLVLGISFNIRGQMDEASHELRRAIAAARVANRMSIEIRCHMNLGIVCYQQGDWANALEYYHAALLGARANNDSSIVARVWSNIAIVQHIRGELDDALAAAAQARELKEQMGDRIGVANADNTRANVLLALEHYDQARSICENAIAEAENGGAERLLGGYLDTLAQIQLAQGKAAEAFATLRKILGLPGACADASLMRDVHCHLVLALLAQGKVEDAQSEWVTLTESNDPRQYIEQNLAGGWLLRARPDYCGAHECLRRASERMELNGYALYANGVRRLGNALQNPSQPADYRF
jgi:tetratricopeptide (TPR) repeat protein/transcriptional regulator with XRE-family HTH domain